MFRSSTLPEAKESVKIGLGSWESTMIETTPVDASKVLHPGQSRTGPLHSTIGAGQL